MLDKIVLMPYGAVLSGDMTGISKRAELAVCLAGPLANGATALGFVALWWLYPETYPYTDVAAYISLSLFLVNLLPAYPLDGGRVLRLLLRPIGERRADIVCRTFSLLCAAGILGYFVWTCFSTPAFTALCFAVLLAVGGFGGGRYCRIPFSKNFSRGVEELRIAISADATLQDAMRFVREDRYLTLLLFEGESFFAELTEEEYLRALSEGGYHEKLRKFVTG